MHIAAIPLCFMFGQTKPCFLSEMFVKGFCGIAVQGSCVSCGQFALYTGNVNETKFMQGGVGKRADLGEGDLDLRREADNGLSKVRKRCKRNRRRAELQPCSKHCCKKAVCFKLTNDALCWVGQVFVLAGPDTLRPGFTAAWFLPEEEKRFCELTGGGAEKGWNRNVKGQELSLRLYTPKE